MLKKLGLVSVGLTAGLLAAAPIASASESHHAAPDCNVVSDAAGGNNAGVERCNRIGEGNGEGNTLDGTEVPGLPGLPPLPELPGLGGVAGGLPSQFELPAIPA